MRRLVVDFIVASTPSHGSNLEWNSGVQILWSEILEFMEWNSGVQILGFWDGTSPNGYSSYALQKQFKCKQYKTGNDIMYNLPILEILSSIRSSTCKYCTYNSHGVLYPDYPSTSVTTREHWFRILCFHFLRYPLPSSVQSCILSLHPPASSRTGCTRPSSCYLILSLLSLYTKRGLAGRVSNRSQH